MKAGRILVALLILIGLSGLLINGSATYARMLYLGILLGAGSFIWTFLLGRSFELKRSARVVRANAGDVFEEFFEVVNGSRLLAPWVEVTNLSKMPFSSGSRLLAMVNGKQRRSYVGRAWLTRRGAFQLGPTRLTVGDPFGLFRSVKEIQPTQTLIVLPMLFDIKSFFFPRGLLPGGQVIRRKSVDITPHAAGVREYVHGDAMKRIHWPTSIRRGQLMVKEFEQDPQAEIWIFLDAQKNTHVEKPQELEDIPPESMLFGRKPKFNLPPSTLEYSISIAASLSHYFLSERRAVGYVSAGQIYTVLPAERSDRQEAKILETLAFVEANGTQSLAALVEAQASQLPQGSSAILVTASVQPDLLAAVDDLQRRYLRPIVILLNASTFHGRRGTDKLAQSLRERRVAVCIVSCDDDLSKVISSFSQENLSQNMRQQETGTWQIPALSQ